MSFVLPKNIAFVDIETTGLSASYDRIIEIGIVRVEDNKIVNTFHSLINPGTYIPKEITGITGITSMEVEHAPTFRALQDDIADILRDCVFVAHNVRFDYSFLKSEFKREGKTFSSKQFCTVKLSRQLFPTHPRHNLDAIIERFSLACTARHRALGDAQVLVDFYHKLQNQFTQEELALAIATCMKKPSLPLKIHQTELDSLPDTPGVYIFYGQEGTPLYVGKSINIKHRVLDHFSSDIHSSTEMKISQQIESLETITTAGELGALLLESHLIKQMLPLYNKVSRLKRELVVIKQQTNEQGYLTCSIESVNTITPADFDTTLLLCKSRRQAKVILADIASEYTLCEKLLGLESGKASSCFAYRLNRCNGACVETESPDIYNVRFAAAFAQSKIHPWPFPGAIMIEEASLDGSTDYFVVDKWCYGGSVTIDSEGNKKTNLTHGEFDFDVYKILKQFLVNPKRRQKIKPFISEE